MDFFKGFKTLFINSAIVLVPILDYLANNGGLLTSLISNPATATAVVSGIGLVNVVLRTVTTTAVGRK